MNRRNQHPTADLRPVRALRPGDRIRYADRTEHTVVAVSTVIDTTVLHTDGDPEPFRILALDALVRVLP